MSKTIKAYKLFRLMKDGTIAPLFINKRQRIPQGEWLDAENHPTKGFAVRPGWHCCLTQEAPHLSKKGRIWCEVEIKDYKFFGRPESQGGAWALANKMKLVRRLA